MPASKQARRVCARVAGAEAADAALSRRSVLLGGAGLLVQTLLPAGAARAEQAPAFARFVARGRHQAEAFVAAPEAASSDGEQRAYLDTLATLLAPVRRFPSETYVDHPWGENGSIRAAHEDDWPLRLYFVRLRAGAELPVHDHVGHVGLLRILSGRVRVRTFREIEGTRTPRGVEIVRTSDRVLRAGETTRVHRALGVHSIEALGDASFLDVMTVTVGRGEPVGSRRLRCPSEGPHCTATWIDS